MKCLLLHCHSFDYALDHPTPAAERAENDTGHHEDVLVAFVAAEPGDREKVGRAAKEIRRQARRASARMIVINPFVHLTERPATPAEAAEVGRRLIERLRETADLPVEYTSFGWYKRFDLHVLGHDQSQSFRSL